MLFLIVFIKIVVYLHNKEPYNAPGKFDTDH